MCPSEVLQYVRPVFDNNGDCGVGVFVGNYFITAGHVVCDYDASILLNGEYQPLKRDEALQLYIIDDKGQEETQMDLAVFAFPDIKSPLKVASSFPDESDILTYISFSHDSNLLNTQSSDFLPVQNRCWFKRRIHNFYECETDIILHPGSSGSPVFRGSEVIGILTGKLGSSKPEDILFLSTQVIKLD